MQRAPALGAIEGGGEEHWLRPDACPRSCERLNVGGPSRLLPRVTACHQAPALVKQGQGEFRCPKRRNRPIPAGSNRKRWHRWRMRAVRIEEGQRPGAPGQTGNRAASGFAGGRGGRGCGDPQATPRRTPVNPHKRSNIAPIRASAQHHRRSGGGCSNGTSRAAFSRVPISEASHWRVCATRH